MNIGKPTWSLCKGGAFNRNESLEKLHDQILAATRLVATSHRAFVGVLFGSLFESHPNLSSVNIRCLSIVGSYFVEVVSAVDDEGLECAAHIHFFDEIDDDDGSILSQLFGETLISAERSPIAALLIACGPEDEIEGALLFDMLFPLVAKPTSEYVGDGANAAMARSVDDCAQ